MKSTLIENYMHNGYELFISCWIIDDVYCPVVIWTVLTYHLLVIYSPIGLWTNLI